VSKEPTEIFCNVVEERDISICIDDGTKDVWLPKSQVIEYDPDVFDEGDDITITIPEWLAIEKGLV